MGGYVKPTPNKGSIVSLPSGMQGIKNELDYPVFCFKHLHSNYNISACTKEEKAALISQVGTLSQMTWDQIQLAPRHGLGSEKIERKSIKPSIPPFITKDVTHFFAFRFKGKAPFVGHKSGPILHVLYIDRDFSVYKH